MDLSTAKVALVVACLLVAGCASTGKVPTSNEPQAREGTLVEDLSTSQLRRLSWAEKFKTDRARCLASGGRIVVMATGHVDRDGVPARGNRYFCN